MSLLRCPLCKSPGPRIFDSRAVRSINATRRRRRCMKCAHRWTTFEVEAATIDDLRARTRAPDFLVPGRQMKVGEITYQITGREMRGDTITLTGMAV